MLRSPLPLPSLLPLALLAPASACAPAGTAADDDATPPQPVFCASEVSYDYAPGAFERLTTFPDDLWSVDDPTTHTGIRLEFREDMPGLVERVPEGYMGVYTSLSTLDGFGTTAGIALTFTGPVDLGTVPSGEATGEAGQPVAVMCFDGEGEARRFPVEVRATDEGRTLILEPMVPLPEASRCLAAVTRAVESGGSCIAPSETLKALLVGDSPGEAFGRLVPRYEEALAALVADGAAQDAGDISALTVFTTQSIVDDSVRIAEDVSARTYAVDAPFACEEKDLYVECETTFTAIDYRAGDGVVDLSEDVDDEVRYALPVRIWLPLEPGPHGGPPYPVAVFGHGLAGGRGQGEDLAEFAAPAGIATVAIDAVEHGDHPAGAEDSELYQLLSFFGIDPETLELDALRLRDNFRQSTYDKLQLLQLLRGGVDVDGDGAPDLDAGRMIYVGASLGGIMGPELLALARDLPAAVLIVPGGRVSSIIQESPTFGPLIDLMRPEGVTDGDVDRFFPVLQTLIERGDAANYGPHVLSDRLEPGLGERVPQVVFGMVIDDDVVPNVSGRALARAMGVPHVEPVLQEIGIVPLAGEAPVAGNLPDGGTAGLFQFDRILNDDGTVSPATHSDLPANVVGATCWMHFLTSWLATGTAEIVNPYVELGIDPAPSGG